MICTACRIEVKPYDAHRRSSLFVQLAWCDPCWLVRVPAQRQPADEKVAK